MQVLPVPAALFISKTRISREILKLPPEIDVLEENQAQDFSSFKISSSHLPITHFIWNSLLRDLEKLNESKKKSLYQEKFILPWLLWIKTTSPQNINLALQDPLRDILEQLVSDYQSIQTLLNLAPLKNEQSLFTYKDLPKKEAEDDSILKDLDHITQKDDKKMKELPVPVNDWIIQKEDLGQLKSKTMDESDIVNILFKEDLPVPVDDWEF